MRVLSIITALGVGGAENLLLGQLEEQKKRGAVQKVLYLEQRPESIIGKLEALGVEVEFVDAQTLGMRRTVGALRRAIKTWSPDLVHTHLPQADTLGRWAALRAGKMPVFTTIHNRDEWKKSKAFKDRLLRLYNRVTVNRWKRVRLFGVSDSVCEYCIETEHIRPDKIVNSRVFITSGPERRTPQGVSRADIGFAGSDFLLCNAGRLESQKSQIDILRAADHLKRAGHTDIKVVIMGEGSLRPEFEAFLDEHDLRDTVTLTGNVKNVFDYFAASDLMVMSSRHEGFGLVIAEAFLEHLPVLAADTLDFVVDDGVTGILYRFGDVGDLVDKLLAIRAGAYDLERISSDALIFAQALTVENYVDIIWGEYQKALSR